MANQSVSEFIGQGTEENFDAMQDFFTKLIGRLVGGTSSSVGSMVGSAMESGTDGLAFVLGAGLITAVNNAGAMIASAIQECCENSRSSFGSWLDMISFVDQGTQIPEAGEVGEIVKGEKSGMKYPTIWEDTEGDPRAYVEVREIDVLGLSVSELVELSFGVWDTIYTADATIDDAQYYATVIIRSSALNSWMTVPSALLVASGFFTGFEPGTNGEIEENLKYIARFTKSFMYDITLDNTYLPKNIERIRLEMNGVSSFQSSNNIPYQRSFVAESSVRRVSAMGEKVSRYRDQGSYTASGGVPEGNLAI